MTGFPEDPLDDRLPTAVRLYAFGVLGVFLLVVPWTPLWDRASLALLPAPFGMWAYSGWARGAVSGLGAIDLIVAAAEVRALRRLLGRSRADGRGTP